ncbi:MAG TPA: phytoene desaturase family protein [Solirubrobacterales bacterium]
MARIVVVGSGFGGLAAAARLQAQGHAVTLIEARSQLGGRAGQIKEAGYTFDWGPTLVTAPDLFESVFASAGRRLSDYAELLPLRPFYEVRFGDGSSFSYGAQVHGERRPEDRSDLSAAMEAEIARLSPGDVEGYRRFMRDTAWIYERGFSQLAHRPFHSPVDFAKVLPDLVRLGAQRSVYDFVAGYVKDPNLRVVFSFHPLFLGGDPFRSSAIYSIIPKLTQDGGVWYARGGMHSLAQGLGRLLTDLGGTIRLGEPVERILVEGGKAAGVRLASGEVVRADKVVSNADAAATYLDLVPDPYRRRAASRVQRYGYSMSCFILYLGLSRQYPHLRHHTILMPRDYRGVVKAIFSGRLKDDDLALYVHMPTRTDPTMAPPGGESLYALVPVPNLKADIDWTTYGDVLRDKTVRLLEQSLGMADLERHIVVERRVTPLDFRDDLRSYLGAGFSIEPTLFQSAYFRPHNLSGDLPGLYLVGAGTHPGAGVPAVLLSAEITAGLIGAA